MSRNFLNENILKMHILALLSQLLLFYVWWEEKKIYFSVFKMNHFTLKSQKWDFYVNVYET